MGSVGGGASQKEKEEEGQKGSSQRRKVQMKIKSSRAEALGLGAPSARRIKMRAPFLIGALCARAEQCHLPLQVATRMNTLLRRM